MAKLNTEMKEFMSTHLAYLATVDEEGNPNIGPKRSTRVLDDNHLILNENTGGKTVANFKSNGKVAVAYVDWEKLQGFRVVGNAKVYEEGEYFDQACAWATEQGFKLPKAAVVIEIDKVFYLHSGPKAGTEVTE